MYSNENVVSVVKAVDVVVVVVGVGLGWLGGRKRVCVLVVVKAVVVVVGRVGVHRCCFVLVPSK